MKHVNILLFLFGLSAFAFGQEPVTNLDTTNSQFSVVFDVEAEFPGGIEALHKFINDSIDLTEVMEFADEEMYNKVTVRFLVTKMEVSKIPSFQKLALIALLAIKRHCVW